MSNHEDIVRKIANLSQFERAVLKVFAHYHRFDLSDIQIAYIVYHKSFDRVLKAMEQADFQGIDLYDLIRINNAQKA